MKQRVLVLGVILAMAGLLAPQLWATNPSFMDWLKDTAGNFIYTLVGKVGIGTSAPTEKLEVVGDTKVSANLAVDTNTLVVDAANNRVGVGTTNPRGTLDVAAGKVLTITGVNGTSGSFPTTGQGVEISWQGAPGINRGFLQSYDRDAPAWRGFNIDASPLILNVTSGGNVGIGTANPASKLDVAGTITTGDLSCANCIALGSETTGSYVSALNSLSGPVTIAGGGSATVSVSGNTITVSTPTCTPFNSPIACPNPTSGCQASCPAGYIITSWSCSSGCARSISGNTGFCSSCSSSSGTGNCQKSC